MPTKIQLTSTSITQSQVKTTPVDLPKTPQISTAVKMSTAVQGAFTGLWNRICIWSWTVRHLIFPPPIARRCAPFPPQAPTNMSRTALCQEIFIHTRNERPYLWRMTPKTQQEYPHIVGVYFSNDEVPRTFLCREAEGEPWKEISLEALLSTPKYFLAGESYLNEYGTPLMQEVPFEAPSETPSLKQDTSPVFDDIKAIVLPGQTDGDPICFIYWAESEERWKILPAFTLEITPNEQECWRRIGREFFHKFLSGQWEEKIKETKQRGDEYITQTKFVDSPAELSKDIFRIGHAYIIVDGESAKFDHSSTKTSTEALDAAAKFVHDKLKTLPPDSLPFVCYHAYQSAGAPWESTLMDTLSSSPQWANYRTNPTLPHWPSRSVFSLQAHRLSIIKPQNSDKIFATYTLYGTLRERKGESSKDGALFPLGAFFTTTSIINTEHLPSTDEQKQRNDKGIQALIKAHVTTKFSCEWIDATDLKCDTTGHLTTDPLPRPDTYIAD